ncbi:MAG: hypothetical protein Q9217_003560 [Psora testacea]
MTIQSQNHLIETASAATGSLLVWDTGEYEVLPYRQDDKKETDDEESDFRDPRDTWSWLSDSQKLHQSFQNRKIRIRLHGTRLPENYTLSIRLQTSDNRHEQPKAPSRKRRRKQAGLPTPIGQVTPPTSDLDEDKVVETSHAEADANATALEKELQEQEDEEVRLTNAYPGANNSIGSIHQRRWYLSMDRYASGFAPETSIKDKRNSGSGRRKWVRREDEDGKVMGFEPFFVMGREVERSVITGRTAEEVMRDESIEGFVGRKGWRPVTE